jgi:hypothetical protein
MAQNLIGCEIAIDLDGNNMVCGIVTNFESGYLSGAKAKKSWLTKIAVLLV